MSYTVTLPPAVRVVLRIGSQPSARRLRFYPGASPRVVAAFTDQITGQPVDVTGVSFTIVHPSGAAFLVDGAAVQRLVPDAADQWCVDLLIPEDELGDWEVRVASLYPRPAADVLWFSAADPTQATGATNASPLIGTDPNAAYATPAATPIRLIDIATAPALDPAAAGLRLAAALGQQGGAVLLADLVSAVAAQASTATPAAVAAALGLPIADFTNGANAAVLLTL